MWSFRNGSVVLPISDEMIGYREPDSFLIKGLRIAHPLVSGFDWRRTPLLSFVLEEVQAEVEAEVRAAGTGSSCFEASSASFLAFEEA